MIFELLKMCCEKGASDLHFKVGYPPVLRIDGDMVPSKWERISGEDYGVMLEAILDDYQLTKLREFRKLDLGIRFANTRFRVNLFYDCNGGSAVFRMLPFPQLSFDGIALPESARNLVERPSGLVLVSGPTGAGMSTTLSTFVTHINEHRNRSIVTFEDPIEYVFEDRLSIVSQRQVGVDCRSFEEGIRGALRTDVDVIVVGEVPDAETAQMTLTAAECGKLVFAAFHGPTSTRSLERFIGLFPKPQQEHVRGRLAKTLLGVTTQHLVPRKVEKSRVAAFEVLLGVPAVRLLIAENRIRQIAPLQENGRESGMCTLDQALARLAVAGEIAVEDGLVCAHDQAAMQRYIDEAGGIKVEGDSA